MTLRYVLIPSVLGTVTSRLWSCGSEISSEVNYINSSFTSWNLQLLLTVKHPYSGQLVSHSWIINKSIWWNSLIKDQDFSHHIKGHLRNIYSTPLPPTISVIVFCTRRTTNSIIVFSSTPDRPQSCCRVPHPLLIASKRQKASSSLRGLWLDLASFVLGLVVWHFDRFDFFLSNPYLNLFWDSYSFLANSPSSCHWIKINPPTSKYMQQIKILMFLYVTKT